MQNSALKDSIISSYSDAMDDYLGSAEHQQPLFEATKLFFEVSKLLDPEDRPKLTELFNAYDEIHEAVASEAFYRGIMTGIAERDNLFKK